MVTKIKLRGIRMSAQKLRAIAVCLHNIEVSWISRVLALHNHKTTELLRRAICYAVGILRAQKLLQDQVMLRGISVDKGPSRRTPKARAKGRVNFVERQSCHITMVLETHRYGKEG